MLCVEASGGPRLVVAVASVGQATRVRLIAGV